MGTVRLRPGRSEQFGCQHAHAASRRRSSRRDCPDRRSSLCLDPSLPGRAGDTRHPGAVSASVVLSGYKRIMPAAIESRMRRFLLILTIFVFLATLVELVLEEHTKETLQFVPFALCAAGLIAVVVAL